MTKFSFQTLKLIRDRATEQPLTVEKKRNLFLPALAFFSGVLWDAFTLGQYVDVADLLILTAYLFTACGITIWLGRREVITYYNPGASSSWKARVPYLLLQFLFGSLLSALFILYFRSASHVMAIVWTLGLALLLMANEFLEDHYRRMTLIWALFGFCVMLLSNFSLPYLAGGMSALWFYASTLAAALLTHMLYMVSGQVGRILFVWVIAAVLSAAYAIDAIPPVPLVKRDMQVGIQLEKLNGNYHIKVEKTSWQVFSQELSNQIHLPQGEPVYCVTAVFAPAGLKTRLFHRWQYKDPKQGWLTASHIGFDVEGGRQQGFRGYTYKENLPAGKWKVAVETESGRTVAIYYFTIINVDAGDLGRLRQHII